MAPAHCMLKRRMPPPAQCTSPNEPGMQPLQSTLTFSTPLLQLCIGFTMVGEMAVPSWLCKSLLQVQVTVAGVGKDGTCRQAEAWIAANSTYESGSLDYYHRGLLSTATLGVGGGVNKFWGQSQRGGVWAWCRRRHGYGWARGDMQGSSQYIPVTHIGISPFLKQ